MSLSCFYLLRTKITLLSVLSAKKLIYFFFDNLVFANVEREKRCPLFSLYFLFNYILFFPFLFFYLHNSALQMYNRAMQLHQGKWRLRFIRFLISCDLTVSKSMGLSEL